MTILDNYLRIKSEVEVYNDKKIVVVSKGQSIDKIKPLFESGHVHFGENRVQEAISKWKDIRSKFNNIKLHLVGGLQSNKAKEALSFFDYIHSLDNERLAKILSDLEDVSQKKIKYFVQVNLGQETQKRGISDEHLKDFVDRFQLEAEKIGLDPVTACLHWVVSQTKLSGVIVGAQNNGEFDVIRNSWEKARNLTFDDSWAEVIPVPNSDAIDPRKWRAL